MGGNLTDFINQVNRGGGGGTWNVIRSPGSAIRLMVLDNIPCKKIYLGNKLFCFMCCNVSILRHQ